MRYRLALDAGTASAAVAAYALDEEDRPIDVIYDDVWIFSEPLLPAKKGGVGEPKKAARRGARQARRQFEQRGLRLRKISQLFALVGLKPEDVTPDKGQNIHLLRAQAATDEIPLADLMRVFIKMSKRRGYAGTFRTKKKKLKKSPAGESVEAPVGAELVQPQDKTETDLGVVQTGVKRLESEIKTGDFKTLGQYLAHRFESGDTLKLKNVGLYAHRDMVMAEFDKIWEEQARHHRVLNGTHDGEPLRDIFRRVIFRQRPLKSPAGMVGGCPLEPHHPRAPMAQMAAQAFRIEKQIADLRWGRGRRAAPLNDAQKMALREILDEEDEVSFDQIYKAFEKAGCPKPEDRRLNFDRGSRDNVKGNRTLAAFRTLGLIEEWNALAPLTQVRVINLLAEMGSPEIFDADDWHLRLVNRRREPINPDPETVAFVNRMAETGKFDRLSKMDFDGGRAAYSLKALNRLLPPMRDGYDEYKAIELAYPGYNKPPELLNELPPPEATGNTVVDVAVRQIWHRVNREITELGGPPAQIIVELSRDLPLGIKKRREIEAAIGRDTRARRTAEAAIREHGGDPTKRNIDKYLLWEQQEQRFCPFCGDGINLKAVLDGNQTNFEHILPRSLTRKRGGRGQLVLAHRKCNDEKGDRTPYQAWGNDPERWAIIEGHAKAFEKNKLKGKARLLLIQDDVSEALDDSTIADWTERQLHATSWIAKRAARWLRHICSDVSVSRGQLTAHLRRIWALDTVIPEVRFAEGRPVVDDEGNEITREDFDKYRRCWEGHERDPGIERTDRRIEKRIDHRHHLIDALVIGLADRSLYQRMARNYKANAEKAAAGEKVKITLTAPPPIRDIRNRALKLVRKCVPKHRSDRYPDGQIFKDTAYGIDLKSGKLTVRAKLADLAAESDKATRKNIDEIVSPITREAVLKAYEQRRAEGKTPEQALVEPIIHPANMMPILKLRIRRESADTAARVEWPNRCKPGVSHYKYLAHNGNAYLEIGKSNGKHAETRVMRPREAMQEKGEPPAAGILRIFKGDTVLDAEDGIRYLVKQIKSARDGILILMPVTETREVHEVEKKKQIKNAGARFGLKTVSGNGLLRLSVVE